MRSQIKALRFVLKAFLLRKKCKMNYDELSNCINDSRETLIACVKN